MFSFHISVILSHFDERKEREKGSMRPIVSIDIGQVGNKNDSGTLCIVHICVFNFTLFVYIYCAVRLSSILFFSFLFFYPALSFILTFTFELQSNEEK